MRKKKGRISFGEMGTIVKEKRKPPAKRRGIKSS